MNTANASGCELPRPQPVGVFPGPAGYLVIGHEHDDVRAALATGHRPADMPRYYELALDGDVSGALAALPDDDPIALVNRFALAPDSELLDLLRAHTSGDVRAHVEAVAFTVGLTPDPPDPSTVDGEFAAMAHAERATRARHARDLATATAELEAAVQAARVVSPALCGQLLGRLALTQLDAGDEQRAAITFQSAIDLLTGTDLVTSLAELHVACGAIDQEMAEVAPRLMNKAVWHYLTALSLVDATTAPETFAIANANLGVAYLTPRMLEADEQLRVGLAVRSMREALTVFTPATHPERWSTTQLNLANALVHLPSTHYAENVAEAIELYERVLMTNGDVLAATTRLHEVWSFFGQTAEYASP